MQHSIFINRLGQTSDAVFPNKLETVIIQSGKDSAFLVASRLVKCHAKAGLMATMLILGVVKVISKIKAFLVEWKESKQPLDMGKMKLWSAFLTIKSYAMQ